MELFYVVSYNTDTQKWKQEDPEAWFDGNVWNSDDMEFYWPHDDVLPNSVVTDERCRTMLDTLTSIWPPIDTTP